jgi:hypothetical protein
MTDPNANVDPNADPAAADAGATADSAERNAAEEENKGKLIASLQEKANRVNVAEAEAKTLRDMVAALTRSAQTPAAPSNAGSRDEALWAQAEAWANGTADPTKGVDPAAWVAMKALNEARMTQEETAHMMALNRIKDDDLREATEKHFRANRNRLGDVKAALAEVKAEKAGEQEAEIARLNEALRKAQQPAGQTPPTLHREVPASKMTPRTLTEDEYEEARRGKSSFELLKMEEEVDAGTLKVRR